jgi:hypothetical protein
VPETDLLVGADRGHVVCGRVDRQPVVAVDVDEVGSQRSDGVGSQAPTAECWVEEQVDRCVAELRIGLLGRQDRPDEPALSFDRVDALVLIRAKELALDAGHFVGRPPTRHLGRGQELGQPWDILLMDRPEHHTPTVERLGYRPILGPELRTASHPDASHTGTKRRTHASSPCGTNDRRNDPADPCGRPIRLGLPRVEPSDDRFDHGERHDLRRPAGPRGIRNLVGELVEGDADGDAPKLLHLGLKLRLARGVTEQESEAVRVLGGRRQ